MSRPTVLPPPAVPLETFGDLLMPQQAEEPILSRPARQALLEWLTEIWAGDELAAAGLRPRSRAMFHGGPGTGKTTLAHHLAARLGLPLLCVAPERIVDAYLGSTGRALGNLFRAVRPAPDGEGPVVLFFDEFDALAARRQAGGRDAQREMNSVVDVLLQRIEAHDGILIAATNHADQLDPAIWRRFQLHVELGLPGQEERERILARYLAPYRLPSGALSALARSCETATPALLRQLCEGIKRALVLGPRLGWPMGCADVFGRVLASVAPHPDAGLPPLWARGGDDPALAALPWPLAGADKSPATGGSQ